MTVYVKESDLVPKFHKNRKYATESLKKENNLKQKHDRYNSNKEYNRLIASKRYYTKKLQNKPDDEDIIKRLIEIEEKLKNIP